jgi:hypothetical protein
VEEGDFVGTAVVDVIVATGDKEGGAARHDVLRMLNAEVDGM